MKIISSAASVFLAIVLCVTPVFAAHPEPEKDSGVPISGWPYYIETLEIGGPLSDYGSHVGVKASVLDEGEQGTAEFISRNNLLNMAFYSAYTGLAAKLDHISIFFKEGSSRRFSPGVSRKLVFKPYGWQESISDGDLEASAWVSFAATDVVLVRFTVTNRSAYARNLAPVLIIQKDLSDQKEGFTLAGYKGSVTPGAPGVVMARVDIDTASTESVALHRAIIPSYALAGGNPVSQEMADYRFTVEGQGVVVGPGETAQFHFVMGTDMSESLATDRARKAFDAIAGDPVKRWNESDTEWTAFFAGIEKLHSGSDRDSKLFRMAATALKMGLYEKRNAMTMVCSAPSKVHFSSFYGWDTAFHSLGHLEWSPELARDNLSTLFMGQGKDGQIHNELDDSLIPSASNMSKSQPPVQGWAIWETYRKGIGSGGNVDEWKSWLSGMFDKSKKYMAFWFAERDVDKNGLPGYISGLESGWDDTPRYPLIESTISGFRGFQETDEMDALDLACWIYDYYMKMAKMAGVLGDSQAQAGASLNAILVSYLVDRLMWSEEDGAYYDRIRDSKNGYSLVRAKTPAMFWPLFTGLCVTPSRARAVIEKHLLNPDEFWGTAANGRYPIPTVAFNDPAYNLSQDGYYWQGNIWMITNYASLQALYRYGYEKEAAELKERMLAMIAAADPGGIHETYDAMSGKIGYGSGGPANAQGPGDEGSAFQFGWSSAFVMKMLLDRHQYERYVMPEEKAFTGYVGEARDLVSERNIYEIETGEYNVPRVEFASDDGLKLHASRRYLVSLSDEYSNLKTGTATVRLPSARAAVVEEVDQSGNKTRQAVNKEARGISFQAKVNLTGGAQLKYLVTLVDSSDKGCGCSLAGNSIPASAGLFLYIIIPAVFFLLMKRKMS